MVVKKKVSVPLAHILELSYYPSFNGKQGILTQMRLAPHYRIGHLGN